MSENKTQEPKPTDTAPLSEAGEWSKKKFRARVDKLTRDKTELALENDRLRTENARIKQALASGAAPDEQTRSLIERRAQELARGLQLKDKFDDFQKRANEHFNAQPDRETLRPMMHKTNVPNHLIPTLVDHELGPQIIIHLARHPEVADQLQRLPAHLGHAKLGAIVVELGSKSDRPKLERVSSKAPTPVGSVGGNYKHDADPSNMSYRDYENYRSKGGR